MMNETRWTCDICKIKSFPTFQEALEHERHCTPPNAPPASALSKSAPTDMSSFSQRNATHQNPHATSSQAFHLNNNSKKNQREIPTSSSLNGGFVSQPPSSSLFNTHNGTRLIHSKQSQIPREFHTHAPTPSDSISPHAVLMNTPTVSAGGTKSPTTKKSFSTLWICDVCRVAEFKSYELAEAHEKICTGYPPPPHSSTADIKKESTMVAKGNKQMGQNDKITQKNVNCYSCEKCHRLFISIDEANDHEKSCQGNKNETVAIAEEKKTDTTSDQVIDLCDDDESENDDKHSISISSSATSEKKSQNKSLIECTSLAPFLRDPNEIDNIAEISPALRMILSTVDLCTRNNKVYFRCHFCTEDLVKDPNDSSTDVSNINQMPYIATEHFVRCNVPIGSTVLKNLPNLSHIGMGWSEFFRRFCEANNIKSHGPSMIVTDPNSWNEKWKKLNNGKTKSISINGANISQVMGEYNAIKLLISSSGSLEFTESDIVPMIFPKIDPLMKYLQPFYVSALNQLFLAARPVRSSESTPGEYFRVICIQCVHCGKQNRLSTKALSLDIVNFIGSHTLEECTVIPSSTLTSLKYLASGSKRIESEFPLTLQQVCDLIESYYKFSLAWYKDQKFIVVPNRFDDESKQADVANLSKRDAVSKQRSNKRNLDHGTSKSMHADNQAEKRVNIGQFSDDSLKYVSKDGKTCKLIPFGGVPLINSFTKKKAELLGRELSAVMRNLELCNIGEAISKEHEYSIALRCQLCAASPQCYNFLLDTVNDLPRAILESAEHLKDCPCASARVTSLNLQSILKTKDDVRLLRELCFFIVHLTGMQDKRIGGKCCVVWDRAEYELKENYTAKELILH